MAQHHLPLTQEPTLPTLASWILETLNSRGNRSLRETLLIQISVQNAVNLPSPTFLTTVFENHLSFASRFTMSFHQTEAILTLLSNCWLCSEPVRSPYLAWSTNFQLSQSTLRNRHFHLANKLKFTLLRSLTPKPPSHLDFVTVSQFTQQIFLFFSNPLHKISLWRDFFYIRGQRNEGNALRVRWIIIFSNYLSPTMSHIFMHVCEKK
jgi:hypothetical protein